MERSRRPRSHTAGPGHASRCCSWSVQPRRAAPHGPNRGYEFRTLLREPPCTRPFVPPARAPRRGLPRTGAGPVRGGAIERPGRSRAPASACPPAGTGVPRTLPVDRETRTVEAHDHGRPSIAPGGDKLVLEGLRGFRFRVAGLFAPRYRGPVTGRTSPGACARPGLVPRPSNRRRGRQPPSPAWS